MDALLFAGICQAVWKLQEEIVGCFVDIEARY
jgi:hypothetical protein